MLKHGRAGVPMEVMGLMLGEFVDEYTVQVIDVFAMPQSGTTVTVESVDHVFQTKMVEMLKQTGRSVLLSFFDFLRLIDSIISQTGDGRWMVSLSPRFRMLAVKRRHQHTAGASTQLARLALLYSSSPLQSFESLNSRSVSVVIDPIQSVKGKVVIDAFRLINPHAVMAGREPRQTTSNIGHINKPSIQALIHGLNRHYYSIAVNYRKTELEQSMLMNLHKRNWTEGLKLKDFHVHKESNEKAIKVIFLLLLPPSPPPRVSDVCLFYSPVDAVAFGSIQQIGAGRIDSECRATQDASRRKAGSEKTSGGGGRKGHG